MTKATEMITWILVARRSGAQIWSAHGRGLPLHLVHTIDHPRGRLKAGEINSDRAGSAHDRMGQFSHAMSSEEDATEHVDHEFAKQLASELDQGRMRGDYGHLVLVAPAKLLGRLRAALSEPTRKLSVAEVAKDLIEPTAEELRSQLQQYVLV
jgi:protein required for attachment to host cells